MKLYVFYLLFSGIGYETAKQIATMGSHVIIACRNEVKAKAVSKDLWLIINFKNPAIKNSDSYVLS